MYRIIRCSRGHPIHLHDSGKIAFPEGICPRCVMKVKEIANAGNIRRRKGGA